MKKEVECIIHGEVQGVFYREFAKRNAEELGLTGYAKNLPDGNVEVVAQGDEELLRKFIERLSVGPELSEVSDIEIHWSNSVGEEKDFRII
ncbi:MAG: acylphosphatase [Candidatus Paceibacterota bacterium]